MTLFKPCDTLTQYKDDITNWVKSPQAPVPVLIGPRYDLKASVALADIVYHEWQYPAPAQLGVLLTPEIETPFAALWPLLAEQFVTLEQLPAYLSTDKPLHLRLIGVYTDFHSERLQSLLHHWHETPQLYLVVVTC